MTRNGVRMRMIMLCRIRTERNGGAWCPKDAVSRDSYEWLQVDLGQLTVVSLVETQGRFGNGQVRRPHLWTGESETAVHLDTP